MDAFRIGSEKRDMSVIRVENGGKDLTNAEDSLKAGPQTSLVIETLTGKALPKARLATLRKINKINTSELIDEGIILWFPGPDSYTGEDMAEFHIHGSKAVIDAPIVGKLITAEPFSGRGQFDPSTEDPNSIEEDKSVDDETLENQIDPTDDTPADADTPEGTEIGKAFQQGKEGVKGVYEDYNAALSEFNAIKNLDLSSLDSITQMADMLNIAIPPFRIPTTNALTQKIIGQSKILKDLEARMKQFSLDAFGLPVDLQNNVVAGMKDDISNIVNDVTGGNVQDFKSAATSKTKEILGGIGG